jgi:hypothetical protein
MTSSSLKEKILELNRKFKENPLSNKVINELIVSKPEYESESLLRKSIREICYREIDIEIRKKIPLKAYLEKTLGFKLKTEASLYGLTQLLFSFRIDELPFNAFTAKEVHKNLETLKKIENYLKGKIMPKMGMETLRKLIERGEKFKKLKATCGICAD